jgi:hypothetical protein
MNKSLNAVAIIDLLGAAASSHAQQVTTEDQIIGTWKVVSLKGLTAGLVSIRSGISRGAT